MQNKIVVTKNLKLYPDQKERLESLGTVTYHDNDPKDENEWLQRCLDHDIICSGMFGFNTPKLYELQDVFISLPFVGLEFLDLDQLKEKNITIANSPGCNKEAVTEWIVGVLLFYFRNLNNLIRTTNTNKEEVLQTPSGLFNKNVTILGEGNIGKRISNILNSFDMNVTVYQRDDDLIELVKNADIIINCLSTNPTSIGLLNREFFFSLKKGSFFLSITRPQIYDITALKDAIDQGILIGAADDAAGAEIGDVKDPLYIELLNHPKIFATPHIAWNSDAEIRNSNDMMIDNIEAWINKRPINLII